uniref:Uncharacterized protein n=1 Tax=Siphoviridae sp. ctigT3 TaxID=2826434 RepID=A0A8S5MSW2_9CAUD|nr:MAG TPA: hypothetical protein [Siphoviridae sp. ctigT3]
MYVAGGKDFRICRVRIENKAVRSGFCVGQPFELDNDSPSGEPVFQRIFFRAGGYEVPQCVDEFRFERSHSDSKNLCGCRSFPAAILRWIIKEFQSLTILWRRKWLKVKQTKM